MNSSHKFNLLANRLHRIHRRITELNAEKIRECFRAEEMNRDPVLGPILDHINRLKQRKEELTA